MAEKKKNTKLAVLFILISVILVIAMGYYLVSKIYEPFPTYKGKETITPTEEDILNYFKTVDTDKDGLSDFEEQFQYGTSIYLADSDSDGYNDKEEIGTGSNPLNINSTPFSPEAGESTTIIEGITPTIEEQNLITNETEEEIEEEIDTGELRTFLVQELGLSSDIVDKLDDKTLIKVYNETKEQTGYDFNQLKELAAQKKQEQVQNSSNYFSTPEQETSEDLGNLDMEALRKLLEEQGADPEILDKVDDQTLLQLIQNFQNF